MTNRTLLRTIAARFDIQPGDVTLLVNRDDRIVARATYAGREVVAKASVTAGAFDAEAAAMRTLAAIDVPVSDLLVLEFGPPAMLVAGWADGEPVSAATSPAALREVGRVLRRIHSLPATAPWSGHATIARWIEAWVGIVLPWWESVGAASAADGACLLAWLDDVRSLLIDVVGCQMLFDGRPEHVLVDADGRIRLIDVADLQPGDGAMDLAVLELEAPGILAPVLAGYDPSPAEQARFDRIVPFYVLLRALAAAEWQERVVGDAGAARRYLGRAREALGTCRESSQPDA